LTRLGETTLHYAITEAAARDLGETHVSDMERSLAPIKHDGAHMLTAAFDRFH
jgi:hypothetical protein